MLLLAPLYSPRTKSKHCQMVQLFPFHFFWRKTLYCSIRRKILTDFSSQKESAPRQLDRATVADHEILKEVLKFLHFSLALTRV